MGKKPLPHNAHAPDSGPPLFDVVGARRGGRKTKAGSARATAQATPPAPTTQASAPGEAGAQAPAPAPPRAPTRKHTRVKPKKPRLRASVFMTTEKVSSPEPEAESRPAGPITNGRALLEPEVHARLKMLTLRLRYRARGCGVSNVKGLLHLMLWGAIERIERELGDVDEQPVYSGLLNHDMLPGHADLDAELVEHHFALDPDISFRLDAATWLSRSALTRGHVVELCIGELVPVIEALDPDTLTRDGIIAACKAHCEAIAP